MGSHPERYALSPLVSNLQSEQQYGKLGIDKNVEGNSIVVNGRKAEKGLGSHGAASIGISVPKEAVKFSLTVALDDGGAIRDGKPTAASVQFSILNENVPLKELAQRFRPAPKKTPASKKTGYRNAKGEFEPQQSPELVEVEHFTTPKDKELEVTLWPRPRCSTTLPTWMWTTKAASGWLKE